MSIKYYFIHYLVYYLDRGTVWHPGSEAIDKHPFNWTDEHKKEINKTIPVQAVLVGWQEITEEEYNLYHELIL